MNHCLQNNNKNVILCTPQPPQQTASYFHDWYLFFYKLGSKSFCKENQQKLENICQALCSEGDGTTVEEENTSEQETTMGAPSKRKGNTKHMAL